MGRLKILEYPDPGLRMKAEPVTDFGPALTAFAGDLVETLHGTGGIGLSATQVGDRRAVVVMDLSGDGSTPQVFVNPEIVSRGARVWVEESCLSIPGIEGNVVRAIELKFRARRLDGEPLDGELRDMEAVCLQHEVDHLQGRLFIDRLPLVRRVGVRMRLAAAGWRRGTAAV